MESYQKMRQLSKHVKTLQGISSVLSWDKETYMPSSAGLIRGEQLKTMAGLIHRERTSEEFSQTLDQLIDIKTGKIKAKDLSSQEKASVRAWYRDYKHDTALPTSFVEDFTELTAQSQLVWSNARESNTFHQFAPFLDKIIGMSRKKADLLGYKDHPYDALLDLYEQDVTTADISTLFSSLKNALIPLLKKIQEKKQVDDNFLHQKFSTQKQLTYARNLLKEIGYDTTKGRLDISVHPFSIASHPTDSRITTRINPNFILSNVSGVLHEAGHGLYEMGLPVEEYGTPLGEPISLGMHESQSRWWETRIGHSKAFWKHHLPQLQKHFKGKLDDISLDQFYRAVNKVNPSFIRVEADEVTYSLHVILRFEIEKALIEGSLNVRDIPEVWNAKMQELIGVIPKSNKEGCLQDVHWSMGAFGYFPSYTLGNLYAAQFFQTFEKEHKDWKERVSKGETLFIIEWLRHNIHQHGRRYTSMELLKKVTGISFSAKPFTDYLSNKYREIYT